MCGYLFCSEMLVDSFGVPVSSVISEDPKSLLNVVVLHRDFSPSIESGDSLRVLVSVVRGKYSILSMTHLWSSSDQLPLTHRMLLDWNVSVRDRF